MVVNVNPLPSYWISNMNAQYCDNDPNSFIAINGAVNGLNRPNSTFLSTSNGLAIKFLAEEIALVGIAEIRPALVGLGGYTVTFSDKDPGSRCIKS